MRLQQFFLKYVLFFIITGFALVSCTKEDDPDPEISADEAIYINEVYASDGVDWLELYNAGEQTKDIGGYKIYDDVTKKYTLPSETSISPKGFIILFCDDAASGLHTSFKLSSSGETVYLENNDGNVIDKIEFPALQDGQSYARIPDGTSAWGITGSPTQGLTNGSTSAPAIGSVTRSPMVPSESDVVTVRAELLSNVNISTVKLFYKSSGSNFTAVAMELNAGFYVGSIPALNNTGTVEYYVEVVNNSGDVSVSPYEAPDKNYKYLINNDVLPQLVINEFMAFNSSCCPDKDSGKDEFDDWIEIYNAGSTPVNIAGMYLSDDKSDPFKGKIPNSNASLTTIQPGGFLLVWADGEKDQGVLHLDFSLSTSGEDVGLYYLDGRAIDEITFGAQTENNSWGRTVDGGDTWKTFTTPTPKQSNQ